MENRKIAVVPPKNPHNKKHSSNYNKKIKQSIPPTPIQHNPSLLPPFNTIHPSYPHSTQSIPHTPHSTRSDLIGFVQWTCEMLSENRPQTTEKLSELSSKLIMLSRYEEADKEVWGADGRTKRVAIPRTTTKKTVFSKLDDIVFFNVNN